MSEEVLIAAVSAASGLAGAFLREAFSFFLSRKKVSSEVVTTEVEKAAALYREMTEDLRADVEKLLKKLDAVEADHKKCLVENAELRAEVRSQKERLDRLEKAG